MRANSNERNFQMKLSDIIKNVPHTLCGDGECEISGIELNSSMCGDGSLFVCLRGARTDGHKYAADAYSRGCRAFLCDHRLDLGDGVCEVVCADTRAALASVSAEFYGNPAKKLRIIGITGTKGKTTTSLMTAAILNGAGIPCAYIGSNGVMIKDRHIDTVNTTPESLELHHYFRLMADAGVDTVAMEVSSQALAHHRVDGIDFEVTAFLNLSEDHIGEGEHPDFEDYKNSKKRLFSEHKTHLAVYNADDPCSEEMISTCSAPKIAFSVGGDADLSASDIRPFRDEFALGVDFTLSAWGRAESIRLRSPGEFSVSNAMAAIATASHFGVSVASAAETLAVTSVLGRGEIVEGLPDRTFVIDYAHNGVSLTNTLRVLREYNPSRLICVFGSVGGRTQIRRAELAHAASNLADLSVITSDNPDYESTDAIIREIISHYDGPAPYIVIPDREAAVREAVQLSAPGDIVLFAGKGHETYQLVCGRHIPFSEREIIADECSVVLTEEFSV